MALQIRLTHPLGTKVVDVPTRAVDRPAIVGRAATADVKVPSATVAPEQLALYVHDGYWFAHDAAGDGGVLVNGVPVGEPTALQIGDVIAIGPGGGSATVEVEPTAAAAGHTGYAAGRLEAPRPAAAAPRSRPPGPPSHPVPPQMPPQMYAQPAGGAPGYSPGHAPGYSPAAYAPPEPQSELEALGDSASAPSSFRRTARRRKTDYTVPILLGIGAIIVFAGVILYVLYVKSRPAEVPSPPVQQQPKAKPQRQQPSTNKIFDIP